MKITLDLTDLVSRGKLTAEEAERLKGLASQESGSLGINVILGFGVVAVVAGLGVLFPHPETAIVLGGLAFAAGLALTLTQSEAWTILARVCMTVGALVFCGGLTFYTGTSPLSLGLMSLGIAAIAVLARSGLLAALAVIGFGLAVSSGSGEADAIWGFVAPRPTFTIAVFAVVALVLLFVSMRLPAAYERLAIIGARTAALIVNCGLLFASVFGDETLHMSGSAFAVLYAVLLIAAATWGIRVDRRWIINTAGVFGALHFIVQWFVYLGANPLSVLGGGVLLVVFGMALWSFNRRRRAVVPVAV